MRERTERPDGLGANAAMEADIAGGVAEFILAGRADELRRAPTLGQGPGPSDRIAEFLAG
jgi:UDP-N-acetylglucosamine 2-epimerase (non-hydrolysing)